MSTKIAKSDSTHDTSTQLLPRILREGYGPGAWHGADLKAALADVNVPGLLVELGGDIFATFSQPASEFIGVVAAIIIGT